MQNIQWKTVGKRQDLIPGSGIAVLTEEGPVAIFHLPGASPCLYAISHYDPLGKANVLARGIVGDIQGEPVVASPLFKQHFSLDDGRCLEQQEVRVKAYPVQLRGEQLCIGLTAQAQEASAA